MVNSPTFKKMHSGLQWWKRSKLIRIPCNGWLSCHLFQTMATSWVAEYQCVQGTEQQFNWTHWHKPSLFLHWWCTNIWALGEWWDSSLSVMKWLNIDLDQHQQRVCLFNFTAVSHVLKDKITPKLHSLQWLLISFVIHLRRASPHL